MVPAHKRRHYYYVLLILLLRAAHVSSAESILDADSASTFEESAVLQDDAGNAESITIDNEAFEVNNEVFDETNENDGDERKPQNPLPEPTTIDASRSKENGSCSGTTTNNHDNDRLKHKPPTHFKIAAHIQTNIHTGYSYFLPEDQLKASFAHLPFLDCGAQGTTTEGVPLVSGVFRHVPKIVKVPKERDIELDLDIGNPDEVEDQKGNIDMNIINGPYIGESEDHDNFGSGSTTSQATKNDYQMKQVDDMPNRPAPPRYVVVLSPLEITVGGNGNETQQFSPGDVIFMEDAWWGVWNDFDTSFDNPVGGGDTELNAVDSEDSHFDQTEGGTTTTEASKMKGYAIKASTEGNSDSHFLILTVPAEIHRHWKHIQLAMETAKIEQENAKSSASEQRASHSLDDIQSYRQPWWKLPTKLLRRNGVSTQSNGMLPPPCSLESDPSFSHPSVSSTSLTQHFHQHFTQLLNRVVHSDSPPSFLPHHHQDLLLPVLAQTLAAAVGGATSFALVIQLSRMVSVGTAVAFGGLCLIGLGTWGIVWLGEEILDEMELWKERRRLEKRMSEGWGQGGNSGRKKTMSSDQDDFADD
mmetsp:Transcript_28219/g.57736  ORF Transcript_28219/g.57736 Transcript_28219/m.57736 type:complete len:586 (-) Transcript_28219:131-1888(-)